MPGLETAIFDPKDIYDLIVGNQSQPFDSFRSEPANFQDILDEANWACHVFPVSSMATVQPEIRDESIASIDQAREFFLLSKWNTRPI